MVGGMRSLHLDAPPPSRPQARKSESAHASIFIFLRSCAACYVGVRTWYVRCGGVFLVGRTPSGLVIRFDSVWFG